MKPRLNPVIETAVIFNFEVPFHTGRVTRVLTQHIVRYHRRHCAHTESTQRRRRGTRRRAADLGRLRSPTGQPPRRRRRSGGAAVGTGAAACPSPPSLEGRNAGPGRGSVVPATSGANHATGTIYSGGPYGGEDPPQAQGGTCPPTLG